MTSTTHAPADTTVTLAIHDDHLSLSHPCGQARFHHVWLRDNCACSQCRVHQSGERALFTASIPDDIAPVSAQLGEQSGNALEISWNDGHRSRFDLAWLLAHDYSTPHASRPEPVLWNATLQGVPTFRYEDVIGTTQGQIGYLEAVRDYGVAVVSGTPSVSGEVERFAQTLGHVRETAFERIHNVRHDPLGYNVAHTPVELKPHTDLPSYHWPPSIQLLHFLVNEASGGETTVTDGWAVLADLRAHHPEDFDILTRVPVTYQLFSSDEDTRASAPMIQLDATGRVQTFRFSNQLAQPLSASFDQVAAFYAAYRRLGRMIDGDKYKVCFKTASGDLVTVHGHRVLHGRLAFDPASGGRHLQDVYMEYDDLMSRLRVIRGEHLPARADGERP